MSYATTILADNPVAYYRLDETTGTTAHDQTSNHYDATLSGGFTLSQPGALSNDSDTAIAFASTGMLSLPRTLNYTTFSAFSLEFWINTGTLWQYFAVTCDGTNTLAYLNGALVPLGSLSTVELGLLFDFAGSYLAATLDEVAIYNYSLTAAQVAVHYAAASATATPVTPFTYAYGSFAINAHSGGLGYFLIAKDLDFVEFQPQLSPLALYDGYTITGYQVRQRQIQVDLIVVGISRVDCIARKDALEAALALRDQQLIIHEDGRYWVANAISGKAKFAAGQGIVQCKIPVVFVCANPYAQAVSQATPYDSGPIAYTSQYPTGTYTSPIFSVAGGGTAYSWPHLHLTHSLAAPGGTTTLSVGITAGYTYTSLSVVSAPAIRAGQKLLLYYSYGSPLNVQAQKVTASAAVTAGATTIPVNSFVAAYSLSTITTFVSISTAWSVVAISQLTDNYQSQSASQNDQTYTLGPAGNGGAILLPQLQNDTLDLYCDPATGTGWTVAGTSSGFAFSYQPVGAFPPLQAGATSWQISITSDYQPTADFSVIWTPRYMS
jgi:hypothetical protein